MYSILKKLGAAAAFLFSLFSRTIIPPTKLTAQKARRFSGPSSDNGQNVVGGGRGTERQQ